MPWVLATVPLVLAASRWSHGTEFWVRWALPIAVAHVAVTAVGRRAPRWFPWVAAAMLPILAVVLGGWRGTAIALLGTTALVIWSYGLGTVDPAPPRLRPSIVLRPAMAAAAGAGVVLIVTAPALRAGLLVMAVAGALAIGAALWPGVAAAAGTRLAPAAARVNRLGRRIDTVVRAVAHAAGIIVAGFAMVPAALAISVLWVVARLVGHDPLAAPTPEGTEWAQRLGTDPHPDRHYSGAEVADHRPLSARLSKAALSVVVVALLAGGTVALYRPGAEPARPSQAASEAASGASDPDRSSSGDAEADCGTAPDDPVLSSQPGYEQLVCDQLRASSRGEYLASTGFRLRDFDGEYVSIRDGRRRTWRPPACDCQRVTVWWFGGSAAWGEGQRDLFTLPSMLARAAWGNGVALDIVNLAMPTYTFNQEVHLLAQLTSELEPPDLIVSYSGGNDLVFQALRASRGRPDDESDITLLEQTLDDVVRNGVPVEPDRIRWTPNPQMVDATFTDDLTSTIADHAINRYDRNRDLAQRLADSIDRPIAFVWQPLLAGSSPAAGPPDVVPPGLLEGFAAMVGKARDQLSTDVVDLGGTFADADVPVFYDLFHTGELGAAEVADALWPELRSVTLAARDEAASRAGG